MLVLERLVVVARRVGTGTLERSRAKSQRGTNPPRLCFFRSPKRPDLVFRIAAQSVPPHEFWRQRAIVLQLAQAR